jgi:glycopeptide antibiotics resistance protein
VFNQLLKSFIFSAALALPFWVAFRVKANAARKRLRERTAAGRELLLTLLFLYLVFLAALTVVPIPMSRFRAHGTNDLNLVPVLNSLKCFSPGVVGRRNVLLFCLQNMAGNVLLFLPLGILLPSVSAKFDSLARVLAVAFALSAFVEAVQFMSRLIGTFRTVDVDDVLLNTLGAAVGFFLFTAGRRTFGARARLPLA